MQTCFQFFSIKRQDGRLGKHQVCSRCQKVPKRANFAPLQTSVDKKQSHPIAAKAIKANFHKDDFAKMVAKVEDEVQVFRDVRTILKLKESNLLK